MTNPNLQPAYAVRELLQTLIEQVGRFNEAQVCCHDITYSAYRMLRTIHQSGSPSLSALAAALTMSPSGLTRLVDRLEQKQYVQRVADIGDARVSYVEILPDGRKLLQTIDVEAVQFVERILAALPTPLEATVVPMLRALVDAAQTITAPA
ncbi:MAG: MarR family transcriptional regulator [Herpetosiphonaceae bacterium]|nr:MarR family transcriptional regulator [Herpetosiphonaceae bacterium]